MRIFWDQKLNMATFQKEGCISLTGTGPISLKSKEMFERTSKILTLLSFSFQVEKNIKSISQREPFDLRRQTPTQYHMLKSFNLIRKLIKLYSCCKDNNKVIMYDVWARKYVQEKSYVWFVKIYHKIITYDLNIWIRWKTSGNI